MDKDEEEGDKHNPACHTTQNKVSLLEEDQTQ